MTNEEIKKKAPEGATHYAMPAGNLTYLKRGMFGYWMCYIDHVGHWVTFNIYTPSIKPL